MAKYSTIWSVILVDERVGSTRTGIRCFSTNLRYCRYLNYCPDHCGSGEFWYCTLFNRTGTNWLKRPLGIAIELLAAIPSIVYGMWGLFIFAPLFATYFQEPVGNVLSSVPIVGELFSGPAFGIGILAAGVILAIMIIPYIASVMRDVFEQTPVMMKESAYGIGCTTWEVIWNIVLPYTRNGVIGGVMLGLGRALGETMAVTFIIGNTYQLDSASLFMPGNSITSALANEFAEAETGLHTAALMELGLILFVITFIVLAISKFMTLRLSKNEGAR